MERIARTVLATICTSLLAGCGLFDSGTRWESGEFSVYWIDTQSNTSLGYDLGSGSHFGIAEPCVFAAGETAQYIAVKRIPVGSSGPAQVIVIDKNRYQPTQEGAAAINGPYSEQEYSVLASSENLPALTELMPRSACRSEA